MRYLLRVLGFLRAAGMATVEPRPEAQRAFLAELDRRMRPTVWAAGGCQSWYFDPTGRIRHLARAHRGLPVPSAALRSALHLLTPPRRPAPAHPATRAAGGPR